MSHMNRRRALQLLAALGTTGLVAGCGTDDDGGETIADGSPIKIGLIAPESGIGKAVGQDMVNGFELYLSMHDQRLGGHPVTLEKRDEGDTAKTGQAAVNDLLKQGVLALTGVANPVVMSGIRDIVEKARVPLIGSNASPVSLQSVVYIWRTSYVLDEPGRALGGYLKERMPPGSKVVVIAPEGGGSLDVVQGFRQAFGVDDPRLAGEPIWARSAANPGENTYAADIRAALAREPDAIFCHFTGQAAIQFIRQLRRNRPAYTGPLYAPGFLTEGNVLNEVRGVLLDDDDNLLPGTIQTASNYSADLNNAANRVFASAYRKTFNVSPSTYAMASYDAAQVLDKAIRLAGPDPTPQQVNLALGKIGQIDSPRGVWQFNQPRTPQQKWYLRTVQLDGRLLSNVMVSEVATLG
ncbi:ABC transporter substrate-binding protein [Micromonospora coxensis]|uniref:Amino acid/amide ABC transporter substrate-binding protein, HAAT family n=1 Tax=Micromonospora coxensis TaxID=356852 RepID=A0A1C5IP59_9ACTN|nr:ABC transporter substrate-binding protein [Micromonospora coxensis]SCG60085.1 amino acid/amide ABC transporter substrate-binding protein, HAAT family [Micromonospora coxensis]